MSDIDLAIEALLRARATGGAENPMTVGQLWERYQPVSRAHNRDWRTVIHRSEHVLRLMGSERAMALTASTVARYRAQRLIEPSRKPGNGSKLTAVATVNREVALLKRLCSWAAEEAVGLIPHSPISRLRQDKEDNAREVIYSDEDIDRMIAVCRTPPFKNVGAVLAALILVLRDTGMRINEARTMELSQIDVDTRTVYLNARATKTRRARATRISDRALDAIEAINWKGKRFVFENVNTGKPYLYGWICIRFVDVVEYLGLKGPNGERPSRHDLRRTFATMARRQGVPEGVVMRMTGHRTRSTFDRYGIVGSEDVEAAHRIMDRHERRKETPAPKPDKYPLRRRG